MGGKMSGSWEYSQDEYEKMKKLAGLPMTDSAGSDAKLKDDDRRIKRDKAAIRKVISEIQAALARKNPALKDKAWSDTEELLDRMDRMHKRNCLSEDEKEWLDNLWNEYKKM